MTTEALCAPQYQVVTEELPPYSYTESGDVTGVCSEIVKALMRKMGHPEKITSYSWSRAYNLTLQNEGYILFSTGRNASREKLFKWVGPLIPDRTVLFARKGSGLVIRALDDAKKVKSIGTYKDDVGEIMLKERGFTNINSILDDKFNVQKLAAGRIDLWITSEIAGHYVARKMGVQDKVEKIFEVGSDHLYLAFNIKTPDSEIVRWQKALDEIKSDGTYAQILRKYDVKP
ncbi:MAG: transporter substrate-binding domain-containing protein [Nitrospirota bacterium]|nr:transporter substrate-binding domain-containing protein [Nitrospirota bacterium]